MLRGIDTQLRVYETQYIEKNEDAKLGENEIRHGPGRIWDIKMVMLKILLFQSYFLLVNVVISYL